jgi:hypothetical protein
MVSYRKNPSDPALSFHTGSGQGVVRLNGRDIYCGKYGTPECGAKYHLKLADWVANGQKVPPTVPPKVAEQAGAGEPTAPGDITINELAEAYLTYARGYYRKNGEPTFEITDICLSIRALRERFGTLPVRDFGPLRSRPFARP